MKGERQNKIAASGKSTHGATYEKRRLSAAWQPCEDDEGQLFAVDGGRQFGDIIEVSVWHRA